MIDRLNAALEGRYRVDSEIGEGGMATVYLAEDLKHHRKVALKVLKPELAAVVGAERFLTEIETTANLSHPNILPLFDSGEADGFLFYVMPYVEGESLRERVQKEKQLPVDETVRIATDVAEALDHAHRHGVIHRDVKPANILLQDGRPVVADFGIALAVSAAGGGRLTETGLSLGTPYYMSPEQATGDREVDARSDTYALGCVVYEMLTGEPPHSGSTAQAVLGRILMGEVDPPTVHRKAIPANVEAALLKALEKLPADRFGSAKEFADALKNPAYRHPKEKRRAVAKSGFGGLSWGPWLAGAVLAAAAVAVGFLAGRGSGASTGTADVPTARFTLEITRADISRGTTGALTPDGADLIYVGVSDNGRAQLFHRPLASLESRPIVGTEGSLVERPFLSPDGRSVGFYSNQQLRTVSIEGGGARTIVPWGPTGQGATWTTGDLIVYNPQAPAGLMVTDTRGGEPRQLTRVDSAAGEYGHWSPHALPDGEQVLFAVWKGASDAQTIALASLETGETRYLVDGHSPHYVEPGYLVYGGLGGDLRAVRFDPDRGEILGEPVILMPEIARGPQQINADFAVSRTGTLTYLESQSATVPILIDRDGTITQLATLQPGGYRAPRFSPDGRRFVVEYGDDLWIYDFELETFSPLTVREADAFYPLWTPDGERILFSRQDGADMNVYAIPADLGEGPTPLLTQDGQQRTQDISPDGRHVLIRQNIAAGGYDLFTLSLEDGELTPWLESGGLERAPTFSPGGRWVAYSSDESGRDEVYVRAFPGPGGRIPVSTGGGTEPAWSPDGRRLYYRSASRIEAVDVETEPTFRVLSRPATVVEGRFYVYPWARQWDIHPDGDRFLAFGYEEGESRLTVVVNFLREIEGGFDD